MATDILIVDDDPLVRRTLVQLVRHHGYDAEAAGSGEEALSMLTAGDIRLLLADLRLPGMGGVEATMAIRKEFPEARIIVLTTFDADEDIYRAIESGAKSYLLKDTPDDELAATIRAVYAGEGSLPARVAQRLAERRQRADLSQRELEVLQLLTKGRSNKEIGAALFITEETVKAHLKSLFKKLKVQDRTQAAISAIKHGIVHLE